LPLRDIVLATLVPIFWGLGFALAKPAVAVFSPLLLAAFSYAGMALLLAPRLRGRRTPWWQVAAIALLVGPLHAGLLYWGLEDLTATVAVLLLQTQVPFGLLLAWPILGERPRPAGILGTLVAFAGIVLILGAPEELPPLGPALLVLVSVAFWSAGQVLIRCWSRDSGPALGAGIALWSLPLALAASLLLESGQGRALETASWDAWLALAGCVVVGFVLAYALWYGLLQRQRIDRLMPFALLMPPVSVAIGVLGFGEPFDWTTLLGGLVVVAGVALVVLRRAPALQPSGPAQATGAGRLGQ